MKAPRHGHDGDAGNTRNTGSLSDLFMLATLDMQRPGNIGAGLKVLDMLMARPGFRAPCGGRA